jgi:hypothetical protein
LGTVLVDEALKHKRGTVLRFLNPLDRQARPTCDDGPPGEPAMPEFLEAI